MNKEIEIKVKLKNYNSARKAIAKLCKPVLSKRQIDEYWTPYHKDIYSEKHNEYWRIRKEGNKTRFEYHKPKYGRDGKKMYSAEYETYVDDGKILDKIMNFIDAKKIIVIDKKREIFHYKEFEICLDRVKGLGDFLEIEAKKIKGNYEETFESCKKLLDELGIMHSGHASNYFKQMRDKLGRK